MSILSRKTAAIALTAIFGVAALGIFAHDQKVFAAGEQRNVCLDNLLIPETAEQADFLTKHAGAAYARLDRVQDPRNSPLFAAEISSYVKQGKTVTVTGFNPNGATSTLPDGTKRPVGCYDITIK